MARRGGLRDSDVNFAPDDGGDDDVDYAPPDEDDPPEDDGRDDEQSGARRKLPSQEEAAAREEAAADPPLEDLPEPPVQEDMDDAMYKAALVRPPNSCLLTASYWRSSSFSSSPCVTHRFLLNTASPATLR